MQRNPSLLSQIVASKRNEIVSKKRRISLSQLRTQTWAKREAVSLETSLSRAARHDGRAHIIAEIKRKSPSSGTLRRDLVPARIAALYEAAGAAAISVLTDGPRFGTTLEDLAEVRKTVKLPVLRKDFIIEEFQVLESLLAGADALLLIARILTPKRLKALLDMTASIGMEAVVEVHDEEDLEKALQAGPRIIGINNRDLDTLSVDLSVTERLKLRLPAGCLVIAESGFSGRKEIERLGKLGVDAFLVGTSLLKAPSPEKKLRELIGGTA